MIIFFGASILSNNFSLNYKFTKITFLFLEYLVSVFVWLVCNEKRVTEFDKGLAVV